MRISRFTMPFAAPQQMPFRDRLESLFGAGLTLWFDDRQMIDIAALIGAADRAAHIYCCGPRGMIEAVRETAEAARVSAGPDTF